MTRQKPVETRRDRKAFAHDAGMGGVSLWSVLAGVFAAYGLFAVLAAITAGVLSAVGVDTAAFTSNDWRRLGISGAIVAALVLFVSYFFGGYVAGRMARRAGAVNGTLVFVLAVLVAIAAGTAVATQADTDSVMGNLRSLGVPTSGSEYGALGTVAGLASLLAMLVGSILGGLSGERWHGKLARRAHDPGVGQEVVARHEVADAEERRMEYEPHRPWVDEGSERVSTPEDASALDGNGSRSQRDATTSALKPRR